MFKVFISILIICSTFSSLADFKQTYVKESEIDWDSNNTPLEAIIASLNTEKDELDNNFVYIKDGFSKYEFNLKQPDSIGFLYLHGLFGTSYQFQGVQNSLSSISDMNHHISLTLPGHPRSYEVKDSIALAPYREANHSEWTKAVLDTLKILRKVSSKVIIVGQSTGGLLAIKMAHEHPELVDGLILQEPALKVRNLIGSLACGSKNIIGDKGFSKAIASMLGHKTTQPRTQARLGCEVVRLSKETLKGKKFEEVSNNLDIPILIFNNKRDKIVSHKKIDRFVNLHPTNRRMVVWDNPDLKHGSLATDDTNGNGPELITSELCNYITKYFDDPICMYDVLDRFNYLPYIQRTWLSDDDQEQEWIKSVTNITMGDTVVEDALFSNRNPELEKKLRYSMNEIRQYSSFLLSTIQLKGARSSIESHSEFLNNKGKPNFEDAYKAILFVERFKDDLEERMYRRVD